MELERCEPALKPSFSFIHNITAETSSLVFCVAKCFNCRLCDLVRVLQGCYPSFISFAELTRDIRILRPLLLFKVPGAAKLLLAAQSLSYRSRCEFMVGCLDGTEARFLRSATNSVSSFHPSASTCSDLGCITLGSLYLSGEGSHLRCSNNDVGIWMTHMDADTMERVPAAATLGTNSRQRADDRTV